jgi:hypothetical protein
MKRALIAALIAAARLLPTNHRFSLARRCKRKLREIVEGCVVLSPAEAAALTLSIQAMVNEREQKAFEAGFAKGNKSCRNAI